MADQCRLLGLVRSSWCCGAAEASAENLTRMRRIDRLHLECPSYGSCKSAIEPGVNHKPVQRLMRRLENEATYLRPQTIKSAPRQVICSCVLRTWTCLGLIRYGASMSLAFR